VVGCGVYHSAEEPRSTGSRGMEIVAV